MRHTIYVIQKINSAFYEHLEHQLTLASANGLQLVIGDFNARIGRGRLGEEQVFGHFSFGREACTPVPLPNRDLLYEFCLGHGLVVANMSFTPACEKATYHEPGVPASTSVDEFKFSMLDLVLVPLQLADKVTMVKSDLSATLPTHHFPVVGQFKVEAEKTEAKQMHRRLDWGVLRDPGIRSKFADEVAGRLQISEHLSLDDRWKHFCTTVRDASEKYLPLRSARANKPWISTDTLAILDQRRAARVSQDWPLEMELRKQTKKAASRDRAQWLERLVAKGDWDSVKQ